MFTGRVGVKAPRKRSYFLTRLVNDLWLWWALIHGVSYLVTSVPRTLFGTTGIATVITGIIGLVMELWVLDRYLNDFNWQQWVVVSIVGALLAFVIIFAVIEFNDSLMPLPISLIASPGNGRLLLTAAMTALIMALAQWRVLTPYVRGYGIGPWVAANIVSEAIIALSVSIMNEISNNKFLYIAGNTLAVLIGYIIVGYTLMQILRPYAPATT